MNRSTKILPVLTATLLLLASYSLFAEIYKTVDKDGNVVFTDTPKDKKAEPVELPEINTQPATPITIKLSPPKDDGKDEEQKPEDYKLTLKSPAHESTVTTGQITLKSSVSISPSLLDGHTIQFYMDGTPRGKASRSTNYTFKDLIRGAHSIHAAILDEDGDVITETDSVTIYVHRARIKGASISYGQI